MLSRKTALAALVGAALAVPAMAVNSVLVSAVKLANQSPWEQDQEGDMREHAEATGALVTPRFRFVCADL